jgi:hydrogenase nickel incorporation protein HypA/HybF
MHELSIALSIIDVAAEELERQGGGSVVAIHLKLGPLSGVVRRALESAFELAREGSTADGAELLIEEVPITLFCPTCQKCQPIADDTTVCCRECGTYSSEVVSGRELEVVALEIES